MRTTIVDQGKQSVAQSLNLITLISYTAARKHLKYGWVILWFSGI